MADESAASPPDAHDRAIHETWHGLFATLSADHDDGDLARAICDQRGNASVGKVQQKMRQIADWRAGHALPNRGDLQTLAMVLDIGRDAHLRDTWTDLYHSATVLVASGGGKRRPVPVSDADAGTLGTSRMISWFWNVAIAGVIVVSLVVVAYLFIARTSGVGAG